MKYVSFPSSDFISNLPDLIIIIYYKAGSVKNKGKRVDKAKSSQEIDSCQMLIFWGGSVDGILCPVTGGGGHGR
jgi:hypothetical protein